MTLCTNEEDQDTRRPMRGWAFYSVAFLGPESVFQALALEVSSINISHTVFLRTGPHLFKQSSPSNSKKKPPRL